MAVSQIHLLGLAKRDDCADLALSIVVSNAVCESFLQACTRSVVSLWAFLVCVLSRLPTFVMTATDEADAPRLMPTTVDIAGELKWM